MSKMETQVIPALIRDILDTDGVITFKTDSEFSSKYLADDFFIDYSDCGIQLSADSPYAIVAYVLNIAPLVFFSGRSFTLPEIDAELFESLQAMRAYLKRGFPAFDWNGELYATKLTQWDGDEAASREGAALLFSGGLDSVYTEIVNRPNVRDLVAVWGGDIPLDAQDMWREARRSLSAYADHANVGIHFVRCNAQDFIAAKSWGKELSNWWSYIQHGPGLVGLAAPVAGLGNRREILISSSFIRGYDKPWGSHADYEGILKFNGLTVDHFGFEVERADKLQTVVEKVRMREIAPPKLRVCFRRYGHWDNCCECGKCLRTIAQILIEGDDPADYGFDVEPNVALQRIKGAFETRSTKFSDDRTFLWGQVQSRALELSAGEDIRTNVGIETASWILEMDFETYEQEYAKKSRWYRTLRDWLARYPRLYHFARELHDKLEAR